MNNSSPYDKIKVDVFQSSSDQVSEGLVPEDLSSERKNLQMEFIRLFYYQLIQSLEDVDWMIKFLLVRNMKNFFVVEIYAAKHRYAQVVNVLQDCKGRFRFNYIRKHLEVHDDQP